MKMITRIIDIVFLNYIILRYRHIVPIDRLLFQDTDDKNKMIVELITKR